MPKILSWNNKNDGYRNSKIGWQLTFQLDYIWGYTSLDMALVPVRFQNRPICYLFCLLWWPWKLKYVPFDWALATRDTSVANSLAKPYRFLSDSRSFSFRLFPRWCVGLAFRSIRQSLLRSIIKQNWIKNVKSNTLKDFFQMDAVPEHSSYNDDGTYNFWLIYHHGTFLSKSPQAGLNFLFLLFELGWVQSESLRILSFLCLCYRHVEMRGSFAQARYNVIDAYFNILGVLSLWPSTFSNRRTLRTSMAIFVHFLTSIFFK